MSGGNETSSTGTSHFHANALPLLALIAAALAYFFYRFGFAVLDPVNIAWLLHDCDPGIHFVGWHFFRSEPWSFPLGAIHTFFAPFGTSIALTDSIPLLAMPFKTVAAWLPRDFQYIGLWICLSYCLQGIFGLMLMRSLTRNPLLQVLGALLFLLNPVLMRRTPHAALTAHWLVLAALWLHLRNDERVSRRSALACWFALLACSAWVHPYLAAMLLGFFCAYLLRWRIFDRRIAWPATLLLGISALLLMLALWYLAGYFIYQSDALEAAEYGTYSLNLNALVNPSFTSAFFKGLPFTKSQSMESFAYLGAGLLVLSPIAIALAAYNMRSRCKAPANLVTNRIARHICLIALLTAFTFIAISHRVTLGDAVLFEIPLPGSLIRRLGTFQSHARFFWPVYYTLMLCIITPIARMRHQTIAAILLATAVVLQFAEFHQFANQRARYVAMKPIASAALPALEPIVKQFKKIVLIPAYTKQLREPWDYLAFAYLSANAHATFTGGYAARKPMGAIAALRQQLEHDLGAAPPDPSTLYIIQATAFSRLYPHMKDRYASQIIAGYQLCYAKSHKNLPH